MKNNFILIIVCLFYFPFQLKAQSCCDTDGEINMCYLSALDYCIPPNDTELCSSYSLDGSFMENGLLLKLQAAENFGPDGTAGCNLVLKKLDVIQSTQTITDCGCDIVFVPAVNDGTPTGGDQTFIPDAVLNSIYDWSLECPQNLVIVFQGESEPWGYTLENANVNPNTPVQNSLSNAIYNGPFGAVNSITQGGSFQGVFTGLPATGTEILAEDANGNTTIGLDLATNDLVIGDIGIFCSGGVGIVSAGSQIVNDNDRFVCNIFALGCQLAMNSEIEYELVEKCETEAVTLPNGDIVTDFGNYTDTLFNQEGCDSIVRSIDVILRIVEPNNINHFGCVDDGFSVDVNNTVYDEMNPTGQEQLLTDEGCDSLVIIDLLFSDLDPATSIETDVNVGTCENSPFNNTIPNNYSISWSPANNLSCSDCPNPLIEDGTEPTFNLTLTNEYDCSWEYEINVAYDATIYIPNVFSPNGDGYNDDFMVGLPADFVEERSFEIKIFDRWGAEVFSSKDWSFRWNGTLKDRKVPLGVYTYWLDFNCNQYEGSVTLIR